MIEQIKKKTDQIIMLKLSQLEQEAFVKNELDLVEILHSLDYNNLARFKDDLEKNGYNIEIIIPEYEINVSEGQYKATQELSKIKIKVTKLIAEI